MSTHAQSKLKACMTFAARAKYCHKNIYDSDSEGADLRDVLISILTTWWDHKWEQNLAYWIMYIGFYLALAIPPNLFLPAW